MYLILLLIFWLVVIVLFAKVYAKLTCGICKCSKHLVGKVVIVTGANTGIGYETARDLADRGARVILACRSEARGAGARDRIVAATGNTDVHFRPLDLASLRSVRAFAENVLATEKRLDILINNAGIVGGGKTSTEDGLQICMQANHFGPFLLTNLLLPLLQSSAPSRIVNVSSGAHMFAKRLDFDNLSLEKETDKTISNFQVYNTTKLCNILMTVELERRLKGSGVTAYSLHPGMVKTEITRSVGGFLFYFIKPIQNFLSKDAWEGAQTQIYLAVAPEVVAKSGMYFSDCRVKSTSRAAGDKELAKKLWDASEKIVGIKK